jgi:hypothetical protein
MIDKIKGYVNYALGLAVLVLSALLFRQKRVTEKTESELAKAVSNAEIRENEHDRQIAKEHADNLVDEYHKLRGDDK